MAKFGVAVRFGNWTSAISGSSLSLEDPQRQARIVAGNRAPDALLKGAAGQPARLFDLFKGPHWTLLEFEVETVGLQPRKGLHIQSIGQGGDLIDNKNQFRDTYEVASGDRILVRPDGYVGAIVSQGDVAALEAYLHDVGLKTGRPPGDENASAASLRQRKQKYLWRGIFKAFQ